MGTKGNRLQKDTTWGRGEIGRRNGLKIRWELTPVWVQVPPSPPFYKPCSVKTELFYYIGDYI